MFTRASLIAVALLVTLAGCSSAGGGATHGPAHWLRIANGQGDPNSLNIHLDPSGVTGYIAELSQAYLVRYDANAQPVPELVTVVPTKANGGISADGKTITWHLRHGVKWSDGAPFTADDVDFSVKTILNPNNNEEQGTTGWDQIAAVRIIDPYTIVFALKRPYGSYLPLFFGTAANEPCLLPKHILGGLHDINTAPYNQKPVGIGPFRVTAWRHGDAVELEANPFYWRGKPKLERITFKLLASQETLMNQMRSGENDVWPLMPPSYAEQLKQVPGVTVLVEPTYRTTNLDFVYTQRLVSDVRIRQAVRFAIDRPRLITTVLHGYGSLHDGAVIPQAPPGPHDAVVAYDPVKARALLDAAGWKLGSDGVRVKNGERLVLRLVYPVGTAELDETVEAIRAQLHDVGIEIESRKYAPNVFRAPASQGGILYAGKFELAVYPRTLETVSDINGLYGCKTIPPQGENATRYCSTAFDGDISTVEGSYDPATRAKLFERAQQQLIADVPTVILYVWRGGYAWNKRVTGFHPPLITPFDDMMNVDAN